MAILNFTVSHPMRINNRGDYRYLRTNGGYQIQPA